MVELKALPNLISIKEHIHMEMVKGLLEKYNDPTHDEVKEVLDNADTGSSTPENIRNLVIDIGSGVGLGVGLGALGAKVASKKPAQTATREALESLKSGTDDALGHWRSLMKKGTSSNSEVIKLMKRNEAAAKSVAEGGNGKKALKTVIKNTKREAEIGPRFIDDIQMILQNDTGLSEKEVKKAIKDFMKENANNVDLITLIEAKDPIATYSHSLGVQDLTYRLAKKAGLDDKKARKISEAALVHDIGKIQVPDSIINTSGIFSRYPNLKKWMIDHDVVGEDILSSDPFKAKVARGHHPARGLSDGSEEEGLVTVADVYEALTSKKRSYKPGKSVDEALDVISDDVKNGVQQEEYLDLIKALREDGLLNDSYNYTSRLESPYKSMKANEIKKQVASDYDEAFFNDAFKKGLPRSVAGGIALGGLQPTSLPSLSEILTEFSPTFKPKAEKLEDIKRWYNNGFTNDEIDRLIVNTDFKNNRQVTKLWKLMNDQFKD